MQVEQAYPKATIVAVSRIELKAYMAKANQRGRLCRLWHFNSLAYLMARVFVPLLTNVKKI
ncbi:hypothetical protein TSUD_45750 [Trifolium subterraneum]|nr:hypothetical protein TSUD_45750 [Trifolium subterraneum]